MQGTLAAVVWAARKRRRFAITSRVVVSVLMISTTVAVGAQSAGAQPACPANVGAIMTKVNDYWITHHSIMDTSWQSGAYFTGDMAAYRALTDQQYYDYAMNWATGAKFALRRGPSDTNANDQAVGQTYIELYLADPNHPQSDIAQIDSSVTSMVNSSNVGDWSWIDAIFMSMPDFAKLGVIKNGTAYFDKMYAEFHHTKAALFDQSKGLWWRDSSFTGQNVYWSRGNGWVFAALARVLDVLPSTDPHYAEYVQTFQQMAAALKAAQQPSGFWFVNLGDPNQYPGPETSGTAFFTFGMTWGINHGILDPATYSPVVFNAWNAMAGTSVQSSGALGYVQGTGVGPSSSQPVTAGSTGSYGVGAFLLAGSELTWLCGGESG